MGFPELDANTVEEVSSDRGRMDWGWTKVEVSVGHSD